MRRAGVVPRARRNTTNALPAREPTSRSVHVRGRVAARKLASGVSTIAPAPHVERSDVQAREVHRGMRWRRPAIAPVSCFTGKEEDVEVGVVYFGKRFYNPLLGRWCNPDPLALHDASKGDLNLYAYVRGMALRAIDPLGLDPVPPQQCYVDPAKQQQSQSREQAAAWKSQAEAAAALDTQPKLDAPKAPGRITHGSVVTSGPLAGATYGVVALVSTPEDAVKVAQVASVTERVVGSIGLARAQADAQSTALAARIEAGKAKPSSGYTVSFEVQLQPQDLGRSRTVHFGRANAALDRALRAEPELAKAMEALIPGVTAAVSSKGGRDNPPGHTWHHAVTEPKAGRPAGVMQLVPTDQHSSGSPFWGAMHPEGRGGYSEWAIPAGAPPNK